MALSPKIRINGNAAGVKASVASGGAISATLDSIDGIRSVSWSIGGTDELSNTDDYVLSTTGTVNESCDTTALGLGTAAIVKAVCNQGFDPQTGQPSARMVATAKFYVATTSALEVGCSGEELESDATFGTTGILNKTARAVDDAIAASSSTRSPVLVVATTNVTNSGTQSIDGVSVTAGNRVLLAGQTTKADNGVWLSAAGAWARATDSDTSAKLPSGSIVFVQSGTTGTSSEWYLSTAGPITLGATSLKFIRRIAEVDAKIFANGDGTTNDATNLHTAGLASATVRYTPATYKVSSGVTLGSAAASTHTFLRGAALAVTAALIMDGQIEAPSDAQIYSISGGGSVSLPDMLEVHAKWFGVTADGSTDDSDALQFALSSVSPGSFVLLPRGTIKIVTAPQIPSGVTIRGQVGTILRGSIPTPFAFDSNTLTRNPTATASGTVNDNAARGATQVHVTGIVPLVGSAIDFQHNDSNAMFTVTVVSHPSDYLVTLDRPLTWPVVSTDPATLNLEVPTRYGAEDVTLTGSGSSHALLFTNSYRPFARRIRMTPDLGNSVNAGIGFDACCEGVIEGCEIDRTGGVTSPAIYMQTAERGIIRGCRVKGGAYGIYHSDCYQSGIEDCWAYSADVGLAFFTLFGEGQNYGNRGCWLRGGGTLDCAIGLDVIGSVACMFSDFTAENSSAQGILVTIYAGLPTRGNTFSRCNALACGIGVQVETGTEDTHFEALDVSDCTSYGFHSKADVVVRGIRAMGAAGGATAIYVEAGNARFSDVIAEQLTAANLAVRFSGTTHEMDGAWISVVASAVGVTTTAGSTRMRRTTVTGAGLGINVQSGSAMQASSSVVSGLATGVQIESGALDSTFEDLDVSSCTAKGVLTNASTHLTLRRLKATDFSGTANAVVVNSGTCDLVDCIVTSTTNTTAAVQLSGSRHAVSRARVLMTCAAGICVGSAGDTTVTDSDCALVGGGVAVQATGTRSVVARTTITCTASATAYAYQCTAGSAVLEDCTISSEGKCIITSAGTAFSMRGGTVAGAGSGNVDLSSDRAIIDGTSFDFTGSVTASSCILVRAGVLTMRDVIATGPADTVGVEVVSGATVRFEGRCAFANFGLNLLVNSGGFVNFGTLTANGATGVDVAFTDLNDTDKVEVVRKTTGGTPAPFLVTLVPGTGFTFTGTAGDTSDYDWKIV